MDNNNTASITISVDDYRNWQQGTRPCLFLDPEHRSVETFASIGNSGWPMRAYHRIMLSIGSYDQMIVGAKIEEWLLERIDQLEAILQGWHGVSWDGRNHVGQWSVAAQELSDELSEELEEAIRCEEFPSYWDADSYLNGSTVAELVDMAIASGSIASFAEDLVFDAQLIDDAYIELEDTVAALHKRLEIERDDFDEDDDNADEDRHARILELLSDSSPSS